MFLMIVILKVLKIILQESRWNYDLSIRSNDLDRLAEAIEDS